MTKILILLFYLILFSACKEKTIENNKKQKIYVIQKNIQDTLDYYFYKYEIEPEIIINNVEGNKKEVSFLSHKIKWFDKDDETKIQIDNDLLNLRKEVTLNNVQGEGVDSVDFANNWDQIKYFKFNDDELIGIRMSFYPCTGLGCSVDYFLIYDLQRKTKNYFGTFRADNELKLFHFNNDEQYRIDYLSKSYYDLTDSSGDKREIVYELFSLSNQGKFILQKGNQGIPYYIKHRFSVDDTTRFQETWEKSWFEKIK